MFLLFDVEIFHAFSFRRLLYRQKLTNDENFPIYGMNFFCTSGMVAHHSLVPMRMEIAGANICWAAELMVKTLALRLTIWSIVREMRVQLC